MFLSSGRNPWVFFSWERGCLYMLKLRSSGSPGSWCWSIWLVSIEAEGICKRKKIRINRRDAFQKRITFQKIRRRIWNNYATSFKMNTVRQVTSISRIREQISLTASKRKTAFPTHVELLRFLFEFVNFSLLGFSQLGFSSLIRFLISGLELFYPFPSIDCAFSLFLRDLFISSLEMSIIFINDILRSLSCASGKLRYSGSAVVWFLGSSRDILS